MARTRLMLVDDHQLLSQMFADHLESEPDLTVVAIATDAEMAIGLAREHRPDMIVMDIKMPGLLPFDAVQSIQKFLPDVRVMFLSATTLDRDIEQALVVGARGYVTKNEPPEVVLAAIRTVAGDGAFFSEDVRARMIIGGGSVQVSRASSLTAREVEVLRYLARGLAKKAIAATMSVSVKTVETHTQNLMRKLDIHDRVELAPYALRQGFSEA
ncbi:MAG: response regulator transcription factor [Phycisphaerales bacterium]|nr:response regulator transcription factor [Phycisphaerales bacterium]